MLYRLQLKTFLAVCETGSFSKAADILYITPSAVNQQIRLFEKELGVTLFYRNSKGITLTAAGEFLLSQGKGYAASGDHILFELQHLATVDHEICVGTSLMEKCRLLYDLWILFSAEEPSYEIKMLNIDHEHQIPEKTDLIESVNSRVSWMREWSFMEICRVPFAFAFNKDHPLARKAILSPEDLRGETVMSINDGTSDDVRNMLRTLQNLGVRLEYQTQTETPALWEGAFRGSVMVVPLCWQDILINVTVRPCSWSHTLPYGIFYKHNPSSATQRFLTFISQTYTVGNRQGIVPVLQTNS